MFCLIYFTDKPQVLEISSSKSNILSTLQEKSIQQCIDNVGRKNFVNTLESPDITKVEYPILPNMALNKISETEIQVFQITKSTIIEKGYLYNSTKEVLETTLIGTYYVADVEKYKYDDFPQRPTDESKKTIRPVSDSLNKNYDRVLLQLIESIQKRKID